MILFFTMYNKAIFILGILDYLFKSKEQRKKDRCLKDVLKRTDDFIERTEEMLDKMERDDHK